MKRWMFLCALTILLTACTRPQTVEVTVSKVLQTAAGRMIFARRDYA